MERLTPITLIYCSVTILWGFLWYKLQLKGIYIENYLVYFDLWCNTKAYSQILVITRPQNMHIYTIAASYDCQNCNCRKIMCKYSLLMYFMFCELLFFKSLG